MSTFHTLVEKQENIAFPNGSFILEEDLPQIRKSVLGTNSFMRHRRSMIAARGHSRNADQCKRIQC